MGKLSDAIVEEMKKKRGLMKAKPEASYSEGEEDTAPEGADEEAAMGEFMDALDSGDKAEALRTFKALVSACGE